MNKQFAFRCDTGDDYKAESIVACLHAAFGLENEEAALLLAQHAGEYIADLVAAVRELAEPNPTEEVRRRALALIERAKSGPAYLDDSWPGAATLMDDLDGLL